VVVHLRTIVESVHWSPHSVKIRTRADVDEPGRVFSARAAVITVPLGVLKAPAGELGAIRFDPELVRRRELLDSLQVGFANRLVLRFRDGFWDEDLVPRALAAGQGREFGFVQAPGSAVPVWWTQAPEPVLIGWAGGPAGQALAGKPLPEVLLIALRTLAKIFDCPLLQLRNALVAHERHDWAADPFSRGAYSFSQAGKEYAPSVLAEPVGGTLFFAGEATADSAELGTVSGALESGQRVAREVVQALAPVPAAR
jgi:monoamine oxidase